MKAKSLRGQLTHAAVLTVVLAMLLSSGALLAYELLTYRNVWANDLRTQADLISRATAAALVFNDPKVAQENLALLKTRPSITAAAIFRPDHSQVAKYVRSDAEQIPTAPISGLKRAEVDFDGSNVVVVYPIEHEGETVGTLYLRAQHDILSRLLGYAVLLSAIAAGSVAFAYYVFDRLQAHVTAPLTKITQVAHEVVTSRNWSLRAPETDYRDFKILVDAFNDMLAECGNRTSELERQMGIREKAEQDLRAADSRKDEFLATLAHELRNPLAPMSNAVSLMERADLSPDARARALLILGRQVRHMVRLIDDLLDASRIATGKLSLVRRPTDLARLVQAAVELAEPSAIDKELELSFAMPGQAMLVDGDSDRLSQVFSNLLNNACRYTPRGGTIDVAVRQDGATVEVAVRDSGIGIAPDLQERIFELFEQADKTLERGPAGLGIGLTLARQLVELHGGAISVTSEGLGHGSTFAVRLPLLDAVDEILPTTAVMGPAPAALDILIADDNVDLAESFAAILRAEGHRVEIALDGEAAVLAAQAHVPDVALLDIGMPKKNGYEVARSLRSRSATRGIHLIAITGWGQSSDKAQAAAAGFDLHLVKPVEPDQLLSVLASLLRGTERPTRRP